MTIPDVLPAFAVNEFGVHGFTVLDGIAAGPVLSRLLAIAGRLEATARGLTRSAGDFVLEAEGDGGWVAWQQGDPAVPGLLRSVQNAHVHEPGLLQVADDMMLAARYVAPAAGSRDVTVVSTFLWAKPSRVGSAKPWHQDMAFAPPGFLDSYRNVVTVWLALDPATQENGCLEFVPGSHRTGLFPHAGHPERDADEPVTKDAVEPHVDVGAVLPGARTAVVPLRPGSAVMFDGMILHRSAANIAESPRRAISFVYAIPRASRPASPAPRPLP